MGRPADDMDAAAEADARRILFGTDEPPPASVPLRAGPLVLTLRGGALHDLCWDGLPVWQAVTFPHRDADWWTPPFAAEPATVEAAEHDARDGGFRAEVRGAFAVEPRLRTRFLVGADAGGRLRVAAEAVPDGDLSTNRTGLCLLLPTSAGGDPIEVEHDDGRVTASTVPTLVPPWPPFTAIRALRWRFAPGRWAVAAFSGESFEFEDQRNNADPSFKVYGRSNMMPRPYPLRAGVPVRQGLELWVEALSSRAREGAQAASRQVIAGDDRNSGLSGGTAGLPSPLWRGVGGEGEAPRSQGRLWNDPLHGTPPGPSPRGPISAGRDGYPRTPLHEGEGRRRASRQDDVAPPLPRFGLAAPLDADRGLLRRVAAALRPAYLHASLHADDLAAADLAALAGAPLRLELTLGDSPLSDAGLAALARARPEAVALFPSRPRDVEALRRALPGIAVGGGTPHFFAQINRLEGLGPVDHLTFTVSPLVHGAEDGDVMACPGAIPGLAATLRRRWPGLPVHLGPSAIAMRSSPLGRMPPADGQSRRAMAGDDPRARGLFGAAWALAFAAACAEAGVAAATLMAVAGPSGVAARRGDAGRCEALWRPASAVLARLAGPAEVVRSPVAPTPRLAALALRRHGRRELLLANLGPEPVAVALRGWAAGASAAVLDAAALRDGLPAGGPPRFAPRAAGASLALGPCAVASLSEGAEEVHP